MEIGSVAELVGAATSVIALFTAYWAFKDTRKMLENDTRRLNDEREDAEKRQATMVYSSLIGKKMEINTENKQDRNYGILIVNNSSSIIREVQVTVQIKGKEERSTNIKFLYPGKYEVWKKEDPKYPWDFPTPSNNDDNARNVYPIMVSQKYKVLEMTFLDGMNTKWSIKEGVLSKIEDKGENRS